MSGALAEFPGDIRGEGRAWREGEAMSRYYMTPRKIEMVDGKLLDFDEDRETLFLLLLENIGVDRVVHFGNPEVWRAAIAKLKERS